MHNISSGGAEQCETLSINHSTHYRPDWLLQNMLSPTSRQGLMCIQLQITEEQVSTFQLKKRVELYDRPSPPPVTARRFLTSGRRFQRNSGVYWVEQTERLIGHNKWLGPTIPTCLHLFLSGQDRPPAREIPHSVESGWKLGNTRGAAGWEMLGWEVLDCQYWRYYTERTATRDTTHHRDISLCVQKFLPLATCKKVRVGWSWQATGRCRSVICGPVLEIQITQSGTEQTQSTVFLWRGAGEWPIVQL